MKGIFFVLGFGTILAIIYGCIEETMHIFKESRRKGVIFTQIYIIEYNMFDFLSYFQVSFRKSFRQECKFLLKAHKRVKPVNHPEKKSNLNSSHSSKSKS